MDKIIETALAELAAYLKKTDWYGRENEVVNLFAHSFLAKHVAMSRVAIEVSVKQLLRAAVRAEKEETGEEGPGDLAEGERDGVIKDYLMFT